MSFDAKLGYGLNPQVALRDEAFGALAYDFGNRRLTFLKSPQLVILVRQLEGYEDARSALCDLISDGDRERYERVLAGLAATEVISVR
jgi:putative mycofactocin binding protein MftB